MAVSLSGSWAARLVGGKTVYQSGNTTVEPPQSFATGAYLSISSGAVVANLSAANITVTLLNGGTLSGAALNAGTVRVSAGGITSGNAFNGVNLTVSNGGSSVDDTFFASNGAFTNYVSSGGTLLGATVMSGVTLNVAAGATVSGVLATNGGSAVIPVSAPGTIAVSGGYISNGGMVYSGYMGNGDNIRNGAVLTGTWSAVNIGGETVYKNTTMTVSGPVILNAATLYVMSGATVTGLGCIEATIPTISIYAGGALTDSHVTRTYVRVNSGASVSDNRFDGCAVTLNPGAVSTDDTYSWYNYAVQPVTVASGATLNNATINNNTMLSAATGATINGVDITSGGSAYIGSGVNLSDLHAEANTYLETYTSMGGTITPPTTPPAGSGTVLVGVWSAVNSGGVTVFQSGATIVQAPASLGNGAVLTVMSGAVASGLSGVANTVYVQNGGTLLSSYIGNGTVYVSAGGITSGNQFNSVPVSVLAGGSSVNDLYYNNGYGVDLSTVQSGGSLISPQVGSGGNVSAYTSSVVLDPSVSTGGHLVVNKSVTEVCFLKGTHIRTARGEIRVEDLEIGEAVACVVGDDVVYRPILWIGSRFNRLESHQPDDLAGYPVRILANAFEPGIPARDLLVTPEHCFAFEGALIPIRMLVNGRTIFYDRAMLSYEYFHIELADHAILLAENTPAESYLDTGNREGFQARGNVAVLRDGQAANRALPLRVDRKFAEQLHTRFAGEDAQPEGMAVTHDPDLRLLCQNGREITPSRRAGDSYVFTLPADTCALHIVSRVARPCDLIGPFVDDRRRLGVSVGAINHFTASGQWGVTSHHGAMRDLGWHKSCSGENWTDGAGFLSLAETASSADSVLTIEIRACGPYRLDEQNTGGTEPFVSAA
ncbi:Hint domain-containing protein [Asaia krungthepensis]|uniref:Hedgehog/Intein (Hint) domain-containing protein n=1 Tax=Asaia krungthepensis NRIC 0535 TaxID=1307925 RepID=A0ABQ0PZX3_9PROT|nr:Hint domain-containing protein [Asaia krungthepensis]GBQ85709.1 hypothetical protein AA0535_0835 [Asaia krungthepensis NRIC 0535]